MRYDPTTHLWDLEDRLERYSGWVKNSFEGSQRAAFEAAWTLRFAVYYLVAITSIGLAAVAVISESWIIRVVCVFAIFAQFGIAAWSKAKREKELMKMANLLPYFDDINPKKYTEPRSSAGDAHQDQ